LLEAADALAVSAGKGTLFVAKQFAFEQIFLQCGTVDFHEALLGPQTVVVGKRSDQFLPGTGFASDQNGGIAAGNLLDDLKDLSDLRAAANDVVMLKCLAALAAQYLQHAAITPVLKRAVDFDFQFLKFERFLNVVISATLHGLDCALYRAKCRHDDCDCQVVYLFGKPQHFQSALFRHPHVGQYDVVAFFLQAFRSFFTVAHFGDIVAVLNQCLHYATSQHIIVFNNQDLPHDSNNPQHLDYPQLRVELLVSL
jgi:hypothetical protein